MGSPRVLTFDIETFPLIVAVWDRYNQNIGVNQIRKDWSVAAFAAKWLEDSPSKVIYRDQKGVRDVRDDRGILRAIWKLLDEADIVITQNGTKFDSRKLNARFIMAGMRPPSPYQHWDTLRVARKVACFTSNSLEYITDKLCTKYKKLMHRDFPGMELWNQCEYGNPKAWASMKKYNIHDVLSTEEVYTVLRPWAPQSMPEIHAVTKSGVDCRVCGKTGCAQKAGVHIKKTGRYQRFHCRGCGAWTLGGKIG